MGSEQPTHKHESIPTWALVLEATAPGPAPEPRNLSIAAPGPRRP